MGDDLLLVSSIDSQYLFEKPEEVELVIACDVKTPLWRRRGSLCVWSAKVANPEEVEDWTRVYVIMRD